MNKRRFIAMIISLVMIFTTIAPYAISAAEGQTIAGGITGGAYTDNEADSTKTYEYTVTGSDGTSQTITVAAETEENTTETVTIEPIITWKRSVDAANNVIYNLSYVNSTAAYEDSNITYDIFTALNWDWKSLEKLIEDKEEKTDAVWNYEDENELGISAATFATGGDGSSNESKSWDTAAVHKISGTFQWPEGYDLNKTTITLESVNDANYKEIYDYIEQNDLSDYFPNGKVFPVNDDVYVVMWVEDGTTKVTADNINNYLLFWTGTSGKGIWTQQGNTNADWARTTPATFLSAQKQGVRAFHAAWPNAVGVTDGLDNNNVSNMEYDFYEKYLKQTDYWYTLTDTTAINSVMRTNYPNGIETNKTVHLDLYCFNNSETGGIDELKVVLSKQQETETSVEVQYYYADVTNKNDQDHYLGSATLTNQKYGSEISLPTGTDAGQLDYMRAAAIVKAGNKDVTSGHQTVNPYTVVRGADNIIYVVYTAKDAKVIYLNAPSDIVPYDGKEHKLDTVTVTEKGYDKAAEVFKKGSYTLPDGNILYNVYSVATGTKPGTYNNNFLNSDGDKPERVIRDSVGQDVTNTYTIVETPGILTITYEPESLDYTYDFGVKNLYEDALKPEIDLGAIVSEESDEVTVANANVYYTPSAADTGDTVDFTLTFTGDYKVTKTIRFIPATNVLYEENLVTIDSDSSDWNTTGETADTVITDNADTVYGYTDTSAYAYPDSEDFSNGSAYTAELTLSSNGSATTKTAKAATFTFTGTGFDLISECGTDTGMLVVRVTNQETNKTVKAYIVDTYFTGDEDFITGTGILDYQVPVVRALDLPYGTYTVDVYGYLINTAGVVPTGFGTYSLYEDSNVSVSDIASSVVMAALEDCGFDDVEDVEDVEVIFMDEESVLNGGLGNSAITGSAIAMFAAEEDSDEATPTSTSVTANVYIDGFRVYKPLENDADIYETDEESGVKYASVYDFIKNSVSDFDENIDNAFVYVEYDGETDVAAIADYKTQGPQNEVYLTPGSGIAFALNGYQDGNVVQLSMKSVGECDAAVVEECDMNVAPTATEMYYKVTPEYDEELDMYYVLITNVADVKGLLSLSALKISSNINVVASAALGEKLVKKLDKSNESSFAPRVFTVSAKEQVKQKRNTTISIQASAEDVEKVCIIIDGEEKELTATNKKAVANGKSDVYKYSYVFRTKDVDLGGHSFEFVAYNEKGDKSAPVKITIEVTQ